MQEHGHCPIQHNADGVIKTRLPKHQCKQIFVGAQPLQHRHNGDLYTCTRLTSHTDDCAYDHRARPPLQQGTPICATTEKTATPEAEAARHSQSYCVSGADDGAKHQSLDKGNVVGKAPSSARPRHQAHHEGGDDCARERKCADRPDVSEEPALTTVMLFAADADLGYTAQPGILQKGASKIVLTVSLEVRSRPQT